MRRKGREEERKRKREWDLFWTEQIIVLYLFNNTFTNVVHLVLLCFVLFCFVLFCFVLFCFVLFCNKLRYQLLFLFLFVRIPHANMKKKKKIKTQNDGYFPLLSLSRKGKKKE